MWHGLLSSCYGWSLQVDRDERSAPLSLSIFKKWMWHGLIRSGCICHLQILTNSFFLNFEYLWLAQPLQDCQLDLELELFLSEWMLTWSVYSLQKASNIYCHINGKILVHIGCWMFDVSVNQFLCSNREQHWAPGQTIFITPLQQTWWHLISEM